jgi:thioredoxin reductase
MEQYDVIVIGAGIAGLTTAVYLARLEEESWIPTCAGSTELRERVERSQSAILNA